MTSVSPSPPAAPTGGVPRAEAEARAARITAALFDEPVTLERLWSYRNHVFAVRRPTGRADTILKLPWKDDGSEIIREQAVVAALPSLGLAAPRILNTQTDFSSAGPFSLMARLCDLSLGQWYHQNPADITLTPLFERCGALLATLHMLPAAALVGGRSCAADRDGNLARLADVRTHVAAAGHPADWAADLLTAIEPLMRATCTSAVHRDFHPGNVMTDRDAVFVAIDWGDAGAGLPLCDLGRCLATSDVWFGGSHAIHAGYVARRPLDRTAEAALHTWRGYWLLNFAVLTWECDNPQSMARVAAALDHYREQAAD